MLNVLRQSFKEKPYLRWVLGLVAVSMVLYLGSFFVGDQGSAGQSNWVARVNGAEIPDWRFREIAQKIDDYYRNLFGEDYEQLKPQLQIRRQAIDALIEKEVVLQDARRIGLHSSAADLARQIRNHPSLQDAAGKFIGTEQYKRVLERNYPGGYAAFERILAEDLLESKWSSFVTQPVTVSDSELQQIFRRRTEKTAIDYVVVAADQDISAEVSEEELHRWYEEHVDEFTRQPGRNIRFVIVNREAQLDSIAVPAEEVRAYYDGNQAAYTHPEQVRARHILFRVDPAAASHEKQAARARAEQALERLRGGADFAAVAAELSEDTLSAARGGDLDFFERGQMVQAFEAAAFATPPGSLAPITETPHGFHVIEVTDQRPAGLTPLVELEQEILRLLRFRKVDSLVATEAERLHHEIGSADRLAEVAEREGLKIESAFFNETERVPGLGATPQFSASVNALQRGALSSPLPVGPGLALVVVDEVLPRKPAPFAEVRDRVSTAVLEARASAAAIAAARAANDRYSDLAALARALGREVQSSTDLAPGQPAPGTGGFSADLESALFGDGASVGDRGVAPVPAGAVVYRVTRRQPFDPQRFMTEKTALLNEALADRRALYRQAIVTHLKQRQTVEYNRVWLDALEG